MKSYLAFTKKEFLELIRSYKAFILLILFLFLGFLNPIIAKVTPELIKSFMPSSMNIIITEPTIIDSWTQFFKNVPQFGIIVIIIMFSGILTSELSKGTLTNMLTKGLKRSTIILSKLTTMILSWSIGYWISFLITYFYNMAFWSQTDIPNLLFSVTCVWIFGILLLSMLMLCSVIFKGNYASLLIVGLGVVVMMFMNMLQTIAQYNPIQLISVNMPLILQQISISELYFPIGISILCVIIFTIIGIVIFNKKQI